MRRWAAAAGAVIVLAACLDAPESAGDGDGDGGVDAVDGAPGLDAGTCLVPADGCVSADALRDPFTDGDAWYQHFDGSSCAYSWDGGLSIMRKDGETCLVQSLGRVDLRCSSLHVQLDPELSGGSYATFAVFTADSVYYVISRLEDELIVETCAGGDCVSIYAVGYEQAKHQRLRLRANADDLLAEVGGEDDDPIAWTTLATYPDVVMDDLACVNIEMGNYAGGEIGSTARFSGLNE